MTSITVRILMFFANQGIRDTLERTKKSPFFFREPLFTFEASPFSYFRNRNPLAIAIYIRCADTQCYNNLKFYLAIHLVNYCLISPRDRISRASCVSQFLKSCTGTDLNLTICFCVLRVSTIRSVHQRYAI
jgi:hypothetical protein